MMRNVHYNWNYLWPCTSTHLIQPHIFKHSICWVLGNNRLTNSVGTFVQLNKHEQSSFELPLGSPESLEHETYYMPYACMCTYMCPCSWLGINVKHLSIIWTYVTTLYGLWSHACMQLLCLHVSTYQFGSCCILVYLFFLNGAVACLVKTNVMDA